MGEAMPSMGEAMPSMPQSHRYKPLATNHRTRKSKTHYLGSKQNNQIFTSSRNIHAHNTILTATLNGNNTSMMSRL